MGADQPGGKAVRRQATIEKFANVVVMVARRVERGYSDQRLGQRDQVITFVGQPRQHGGSGVSSAQYRRLRHAL